MFKALCNQSEFTRLDSLVMNSNGLLCTTALLPLIIQQKLPKLVNVVVSQHPSSLDNRQLHSVVNVFLYTACKALQLTCFLIRAQCGTVKATHILNVSSSMNGPSTKSNPLN